MKRNEALYNARLSLGLNRKAAAKKLHTRPFILKDYEEGYRYLKDKKARQFALAYGLEEDTFIIDDGGYFERIDYEKDKPVKDVFVKVKDFLASLPVRITSAILMVICAILATVGGINYSYTFRHRDLYLPSEYSSIRSDIIAEGNLSEFGLMTSMTNSISDAYVHHIDGDENFAVMVSSDEGVDGLISFVYKIDDNTHFYFDCYSLGVCGLSYEAMPPAPSLIIDYSNYDPVTKEILNQELAPESKERIEGCLPIIKEKANAYLSGYGISDVDAFYAELTPINASLRSMKNICTTAMFIGAFLAAIFLIVLIYGIIRQGKVKKEGLYNKVESLFQEEEVVSENTRALPRSFDPAPFICKEDYLRYIFLAIFFIGGLASLFTRMQSFGWISKSVLESIRVALSYCTGIGTFMVFFLKLEAIISRRDTFLSFLTCLSISSLFYVAEAYASVMLSNLGTIGEIYAYALPSNLFSGLASLALFAFFLLNEPKNAKKWQRVLFHLGALLPLTYLIAGFVILETQVVISPFLRGALNGGLFEVCIIGVIYIFFIFVFRRFAFHRYGREAGEEFMTGSIYTLCRNILLATVIALLVLFHCVLPDDLELWTLERNGFFLLLVPVFLLYRTHVPKSTRKGELFFDGGYLVLLALPYVLTFTLSLFE